jgi:hypothetical protein
MRFWKESYIIGKENETKLKQLIKDKWGCLPTINKYDPFDYIGPNYKVELKTRTNTIRQYPTTIVGLNKINSIDDNKKHIFLFQFTDCLAYIEYDNELFSKYETKQVRRIKGGLSSALIPHLFINVNDLIVI